MAQSPPPGGRRASTITIIVVVAVAAIYLFNTNLLSFLLPDLVGDAGAQATPAATVASSSVDVASAESETDDSPASEPTAPAPPADEVASEQSEAGQPEAEATEAAQQPSPTPVEPTPAQPTPAQPTPTIPPRIHGVPTIAYAALPVEAHETIALIDEGGPFPYDKDGSVFQNREGLLPGRPKGYYREYTVETPGSDDRGARRIVEGAEGELYYTDDHYDSFSYVVREGAQP